MQIVPNVSGREEKCRVGVLFGGQSPEHEVSIRSATSVIEHLNPEKYEVFPIGIDQGGQWHFLKKEPFLISMKKNHLPTFRKNDPHFPLMIHHPPYQDVLFSPCRLKQKCDLIFPILHGPLGEDGTVQGLLELAGIPYVGADHLSSAICMDKGIMKDLLRAHGLPVARYQLLHKEEPIDEQELIDQFPFPFFIKPAQMGSSIGVSKVDRRDELSFAIQEAFQYDERILIEEGIIGREIECSLLGNETVKASLPGEIIPSHEFYSYESKYMDPEGARFELPARLDAEKVEEIRRLAIQAFKVLRCRGMARVDFFLKPDGTLLINELNTIPGFTPISLYPKLWEVTGLSYAQLIDTLIDLALSHHKKKV